MEPLAALDNELHEHRDWLARADPDDAGLEAAVARIDELARRDQHDRAVAHAVFSRHGLLF